MKRLGCLFSFFFSFFGCSFGESSRRGAFLSIVLLFRRVVSKKAENLFFCLTVRISVGARGGLLKLGDRPQSTSGPISGKEKI